jgi:integrase
MAAHRHTRTNGPLVGEYLQSWLAGRAAIRASTAASYRAHIERYLIPLLGEELLAGLRPEHLQRAHHQLLAEGMTPATLTRVHATLSAALNTAHRQGLLTSNPLAGVELPRVDRMEPTIWTLEEARTFLQAIRGDEFEALWRLALVTGMRRGELLGLAWADVDLDGWQIRVRTTRITVGATTLEGPPKSRSGRRALHLDWPTVRLLKDLLAQGEPLSGHVFVDANAEPLLPGWVSRRFTQLITEVGLPRIRFHDLRHTSATLGLAAGETLKAVSRRLGHSDIGITANTYAQVPDTTAARDARRLAAGLDTPGHTRRGAA